jgi:hypothetical protein
LQWIRRKGYLFIYTLLYKWSWLLLSLSIEVEVVNSFFLWQNRCGTIYPHELECLIGDPILFKVKKDYDCDSCGCLSVEVMDFFIGPNVMDIYLNPTHSLFAQNVSIMVVFLLKLYLICYNQIFHILLNLIW